MTRDPVKKSELNLLLGDKSLAMGQILWDQELYDLSLRTFTSAENYLLSSVKILKVDIKKEDRPPSIIDKISLAAKKHEELLSNIIFVSDKKEKSERLKLILNLTNKAKEEISSLK